MKKIVKKIAILTSGGDAPGMNALIRAVVMIAAYYGIKVIGFLRGYNGLINNNFVDLDVHSVADIAKRGGTVLYSARCKEFKTEEGIAKAVKTCKDNEIDGLIVIGGDGSFRGARELSLCGIPCIGIPATIDNDISATEYTLGFDTAVNTALGLIDKLCDTTCSHDRCCVVEVMGHGAGDIAVQCSIAVGATALVVPEKEYNPDAIIEKIRESKKAGINHFIVVVSEGICDVDAFAKQIEDATAIESRATKLGHVQRGGDPGARDRVEAARMGRAAVELLNDGIGNRVIAVRNNSIVNYDIYEALNMPKTFDEDSYLLAALISG